MSNPRLNGLVFSATAACCLLIGASGASAQTITQIIDSTGDGAGNTLDVPVNIAVDGAGNVYVTGNLSDNAFKIAPGGVITEIIDSTGDGAGNTLHDPYVIAVDGAGNVYVAGNGSHNAFKITPGGVITEIIDSTGDGAGNLLSSSRGIVVDGAGNVYVTGASSDNAFKIAPGGVISEIIDATGDGAGNTLLAPFDIAVDGAGNVYVAGWVSDNAFKITPGGVITEIIDATGGGAGNTLNDPLGIAVDGAGNVYVAGSSSHNAFQIAPGGVITQIIDSTGDGAGNLLSSSRGIVVDGAGNVYVGGNGSHNAFKITPGGVITEIIDSTGDGAGNTLDNPGYIAVDGAGNVYVAGRTSDNAFKISLNLFVDHTATGANDGTSWGDAYVYVQDALTDAAVSPRDIRVAAGTYYPDEGGGETPGDRAATFQLINGVVIYGGYNGTETNLYDRDIEVNETILDGDLEEDDPVSPSNCCTEHAAPQCDDPGCEGLVCGVDAFCCSLTWDATCVSIALTQCPALCGGDNGENSYHVVTGSGTDGTAVLDGFTIIAGNADAADPPNADQRGGGMYNSAGSPTVTNCTFSGNSANLGAAMYNWISDPTVSNSTFSGNSAGNSGGGIYNDGSSPDVTNCTFSGNSASSGGGMCNLIDSFPIVTNCRFEGNSASSGGGMSNLLNGDPILFGCTFSGNSADNKGGGIYNSSGDPTMTNCSFSGNSADDRGGGMYSSSSAVTVDNCVLWGNVDDVDANAGGPFMDESAQIHTNSGTPVVNYSIVMGGWTGPGGVGNSASDPLFIDADGADNIIGTEDDDLRLSFGSPAIDEGDNTAVPQDTTDLDGDLNTTEPIPFDLDGNDRFVDDPATPDGGNPGPPGPIVDVGAYEFQPPIFVDANAAPPTSDSSSASRALLLGDGATWATAYTNLQDALAEAFVTPRDIWVAAGTYYPDDGGSETPGDRTATFQLLDGVAVYGGFFGDETSLDDRNIEGNETILSGDLLGNDAPVACVDDFPDCNSYGGRCIDGSCIIKQNNTENSYHVVTGSGTDPTAILDGLTITAGYADVPAHPDDKGGGMVIEGGSPTVRRCVFASNATIYQAGAMLIIGSSNPTVTGCRFEANSAAGHVGGAMLISTSSHPTISSCIFVKNAGFHSGALAIADDSRPLIDDCTFIANATDSNAGVGGAITVADVAKSGSAPTITNCVFIGNAAQDCGAFLNQDASATLINCRFLGNSATGVSGGMCNTRANTVLTNCVFSGNSGGAQGGAILNSSGTATLTNCVLSRNTVGDGSAAGVYSVVDSVVTINNSVLSGNTNTGGADESAQIDDDGTGTIAVDYSLIDGWTGALGGTGNIDDDPMFVDADGADNIAGTADDDLRLGFGSPAIDEGDNTVVPPDTTDLDGDLNTSEPIPFDLDGNLRFVDDPDTVDGGNGTAPIVDMGAYEYFPDCNDSGLPDVCDLDCAALSGECNLPGCGLSLDCNTNGIPDECDIANGTSLDCNYNGVPDDCDIASGFSLDTTPADGVPDECDPFTGACTPPANDEWSCPDNWAIPGEDYPDDIASAVGEHVKIASPSNVLLDVSAQVPSVAVGNGATLRVTQTGSEGDLDFSPPGVFAITGTVLVGETRAIGSGGLLSPSIILGLGGILKADPSAASMSVKGGGSRDVGGVSASMGVTTTITAASMTLTATECGAEEQLVVSDKMTVTVIGDLILDGSDIVDPTICPPFGSNVAASLGGRTPPILNCGGQATGVASSVSAQKTSLARNLLTVGGVLSLRQVVQVHWACGSEGSAGASLGGNFDNQSLYPSWFNWESGGLTLTGQLENRKFEVAGLDLGASGEGYDTDADTLVDIDGHTNFAIGTLNVGEVGNPAHVTFVNDFANTAGEGPCEEALYVDTLNLSAGSVVTIDNCRVYYKKLNDSGATLDPLGCGELVDVCQVSAPLSDGMPKNRYLTFAGTNPGRPTAIQVTVTSMPEAFADLEGTIMWVGPAEVISENAGKTDPADAPGFPTFTAATLQCDPYYTDWDAFGGMIHVYDEVILPEGAYDLQAVGHGCDLLLPASYSAALSITQSESGDVISDCSTNPCGPPNGSVDITTDVTAILNKFKNLAGAPIKCRSDLDFNLPDQKVNISDVTQSLEAFRGFDYPFDPGPAPCVP